MAAFFFLIGPASSGKSTIAKRLNKKFSFRYIECDTYHPLKNINKMKSGTKLNFNDRLPWLKKINKKLCKLNYSNYKYIIACSALRKKYRKILTKDLGFVFFIYLKCKKKEIIKRCLSRKHFFPPSLVSEQLREFEKSSDLININANNNIIKVTSSVKKTIDNILNSELY